jgi:hypothetical protein
MDWHNIGLVHIHILKSPRQRGRVKCDSPVGTPPGRSFGQVAPGANGGESVRGVGSRPIQNGISIGEWVHALANAFGILDGLGGLGPLANGGIRDWGSH